MASHNSNAFSFITNYTESFTHSLSLQHSLSLSRSLAWHTFAFVSCTRSWHNAPLKPFKLMLNDYLSAWDCASSFSKTLSPPLPCVLQAIQWVVVVLWWNLSSSFLINYPQFTRVSKAFTLGSAQLELWWGLWWPPFLFQKVPHLGVAGFAKKYCNSLISKRIQSTDKISKPKQKENKTQTKQKTKVRNIWRSSWVKLPHQVTHRQVATRHQLV